MVRNLNRNVLTFLAARNEEQRRRAVNILRKSANKGNEAGMGALAYAYETGQGVKEDAKKAMEWYKKAADKGAYDSMGNYAIIVIENMFDEHYDQALKYLKKCYSQDLDICRFAVGMFILFDNRKRIQKALDKTCKELVVYLNQGAINIYSKHILRRAKRDYTRHQF
jgi:TPR repeat protein